MSDRKVRMGIDVGGNAYKKRLPLTMPHMK